MKHIEDNECRLRDIWNVHAFVRRDQKDKMQQSRQRMLTGATGWQGDTMTDTASRWW